MLIGDCYTLASVDLLDLLDEVVLYLGSATDLEELLWVEWAIGERVARANAVAALHQELGVVRDWVLRCWDDVFGANHQAVLRLHE